MKTIREIKQKRGNIEKEGIMAYKKKRDLKKDDLKGSILIDLGGAMKRLREKRGITQGDIFRDTMLERSYLSKFENNKIPYPRIETIHKIAEAIGVSLDEFVREAIKEKVD